MYGDTPLSLGRYEPRPPRALSAGLAVAITGLMVAILALGSNVRQILRQEPAFVAIDLHAKPPPPEQPPPPQHVRKAAARDAAGPPDKRNKANAVVAPPARLVLPPPQIVVAEDSGVGNAPQTGAAPMAGPGRGAGGAGNGTGGGGDGGEGDGEAVVGPKQTAGRLTYGDMPDNLLPDGTEATVTVVFRVGTDGRVSQCRAERSSSYEALDRATCRLIEQRFRFRPAQDRAGRPVASWVGERHTWYAREG